MGKVGNEYGLLRTISAPRASFDCPMSPMRGISRRFGRPLLIWLSIWRKPSEFSRRNQATVHFLLADPEDEQLWDGVLFGIRDTSPSYTAASGASPLCPWQASLVNALLRKCTPAVVERRLRLAMEKIGEATKGFDARQGDGLKGGTAGTISIHHAAAAVVVLVGLYRLSRYAASSRSAR